MNINYKKSLKLVTLLVTAIIIATVSAQTYIYMYVDGSVTIGTQKLVWLTGGDTPGDATISGGTVTMDLDVQPGVIQNFTEGIFLKNQDGADHNLTITVTTALSTGTFDSAKVYIYKNVTGWESVDTLDLRVQDDQYSSYTGNTPLVAGGYYRFTFEIQADASASGSADFDIEVVYE